MYPEGSMNRLIPWNFDQLNIELRGMSVKSKYPVLSSPIHSGPSVQVNPSAKTSSFESTGRSLSNSGLKRSIVPRVRMGVCVAGV